MVILSFFFFSRQKTASNFALRDGVQTCALPICRSYVPALSTPAAGAAPHARPSPPAPVRHIPSTGGRTPRPQDQIWPYWPEPHPAVPLWRESCRRISASVPAQPLGDSVDGDHFLLSAL